MSSNFPLPPQKDNAGADEERQQQQQTTKIATADLCEALSMGASLPEVKSILERSPQYAIQTRNEKTGQTPLHLALYHCSDDRELIRFILNQYPDAARMLDVHGTTPLDILAQRSRGGNDGSDCHPDSDLYKEMVQAAYPNFDPQDVWKEFEPKDWHAEQDWNHLHMTMYQRTGLWKVTILLHQDPSLPRGINKWGNFPIHEGLRIYSREDSVRAILEAYPEVCKQQNLDGAYPLHYAVRESAFIPFRLLRRILDLFPGAAGVRAGHMQLSPLHIAVANAASQELILALLEACPEAARQLSSRGRTPLYECLCKADTPLPATRAVFQTWPEAARIKDREGQYPLYEGIKNGLPEEFLLELLDAYPEVASLQVEPQSGRTPLHLAMKHNGGPNLVKRLLALHPEGIMSITKHNETPLLLAMGNNVDVETVKLVLDADPSAVKMMHPELGTPLHAGMSRAASPDLIRLILEAYPEATQIRDRRGHSTLHTGIFYQRFRKQSRNTNEELRALDNIVLVLEVFEEAAKWKDDGGFLPLFHFVELMTNRPEHPSCSPKITETMERIYKAYPPAAELPASSGSSKWFSVGTPINLLAGICAVSDNLSDLIMRDICKRLRILLGRSRDGRSLRILCSLEKKVPLLCLFLLFDDRYQSMKEIMLPLELNFNKQVLMGWTFLEILADFDTEASSSILLQIILTQRRQLESPGTTISISDKNGAEMFVVKSLSRVSETVKTKVADRAKLANSSLELKQWGLEYGRFLRRYRLESIPKHVSETCVVVFGTEACDEADGRTTEIPVALKFMCREDTFRREIEKRTNTESKFVVPVKDCFAKDSIDDLKCVRHAPLEEELEPYPEICLRGKDLLGDGQLNFLLVMDCGAGYDLHDYIGHQNIAGKDLLAVVSIAKEIAMALQFLNEQCGTIHGDVKSRNFVARGVGLVGFAAIDLDNSATIGVDTVGKKRTSSGYLPPEQAAIEAYHRSKEKSSAQSESVDSLMAQLSAASAKGDMVEVIRLARLCEKASHRKQEKPDDIVASPQYDMWCFGALLFYLCTGNHLFNVNTREDVDDDDLMLIVGWNDTLKEEKLAKVPTGWPRRLIGFLLNKNPIRRPSSWKHVIDDLSSLGAESSPNSSSKTTLFDRLVVFQSAPLAYMDAHSNSMLPIPVLDFKKENGMLQDALKDAETIGAKIEVVFQAATIDRFSAFFAQRMSRVIHFSGHGHPSYLAWEDGRGGLQTLSPEALTRFVCAGEGALKVVFVSACHSELTGQAFVNAGVPHVVCCRLQERFRDAGAIEFARNFYRALACGQTLLKAFQLAKAAVRESPRVEESSVEADKFLLLPDKPDDPSYHDTPVFFTNEVPPLFETASSKAAVAKGVPRITENTIGREVLHYEILDHLSSHGVIRVHGQPGIGKSSIIAWICDYILRRPRSYPLDYLFWLPSKQHSHADPVYEHIAKIVDACSSFETLKQRAKDFQWDEISGCLSQKLVYLVLDARKKPAIESLVEDFLAISTVSNLKIILICTQDSAESTVHTDTFQRQVTVQVGPLDIGSTISLFVSRIPPNMFGRHGVRAHDLLQYLLGVDNSNPTLQHSLYELLGAGIPAKVVQKAEGLSYETMNELLRWWNES